MSIDIRVNTKDYRRLYSTWNKSPFKNRSGCALTVDEKAEVPIVLVHTAEGAFVEFLKGFSPVKTFVQYGYNRVRKACPYRHRRCIGERCSLYFIDNLTGDCALIWALFKRGQ